METQLHVPENKLKNLTEERIILDCHTRVSSALGDHVEEVVTLALAYQLIPAEYQHLLNIHQHLREIVWRNTLK